MRGALAIFAALFAASSTSCTFPTVVYEEACEVPSQCNIQKYSDDGDKARTELQACLDDCTGNPCKDACQVTYDDSIDDLRRDCEVCSANHGCTKAGAACLKWIEPL